MSNVIAKEKLSAYQRWEMASFEDKDHSNSKGLTSAELTSSEKEELDQLKVKVQKEGFAKGFEEGYQVGVKTGHQEGLQPLQQELASFQQISTQFNQSLQQAERIIAQEVLDLALELTKAMLKNVLSIKPELIIPIIKQAIASLPSVQQPAHLFLHPEDARLVCNKIGATLTNAGWVVENDAKLARGDCRIETSTNQMNGSLSSRWKQLADALGRSNRWYDDIEDASS